MVPLIEDRTGPVCTTPAAERALATVASRIDPTGQTTIRVMDLGDLPYLSLPGHSVILSRHLVTASASPDEFTGWAALGLSEGMDDLALRRLFQAAGILDAARFVVSGALAPETLDNAVNRLLISNDVRRPLPTSDAVAILTSAGVAYQPLLEGIRREQYSNGPLTIPPVEGDASTSLVLDDFAWVALRGICDG